MNPRFDRAYVYRDRAEELRIKADGTYLQESRDILMRLAADYEQMAGRIEAAEAARQARCSEPVH